MQLLRLEVQNTAGCSLEIAVERDVVPAFCAPMTRKFGRSRTGAVALRARSRMARVLAFDTPGDRGWHPAQEVCRGCHAAADFAASWPQAASMSRPRVSRTVAGSPARSSTSLKASIAFRDEPSNAPVGLYGMRLTLNERGSSSDGELLRLLDAVVDAGEHDVLDEHLPPAQRHVAAALGEHVRERVPVVHGHELRAKGVVRRMQGQREPDRLSDGVDEAREPRQPADGRDRRSPVRDTEVGQLRRRA